MRSQKGDRGKDTRGRRANPRFCNAPSVTSMPVEMLKTNFQMPKSLTRNPSHIVMCLTKDSRTFQKGKLVWSLAQIGKKTGTHTYSYPKREGGTRDTDVRPWRCQNAGAPDTFQQSRSNSM